MNEFPGNDNADRHGIRGLFNPQSNPQTMMCCTTSAYFGSPRGLVSCCKTNARYSDKGEVGGSSPPRPTIQITSKYASILTFPLFGALPQKTVLSTVCQLHDWPDGTTLRALRPLRVKPERLASIRLCRERWPATWKAVQDTARLCKERAVIFSEFAGA
jgi:hypothetical protein